MLFRLLKIVSPFILLLAGVLPLKGFAQAEISDKYLEGFSKSFTISETGGEGEGWDLLKEEFEQHQFILLGENHLSPAVSSLSKEMLGTLAKLDFGYFVLEIGPVGAQKLQEFSEGKLIDSLYHFTSSFRYSFENAPPVQFMSGKADAHMLKKAFGHDYAVVGIDREYYSADYYLFDELKKLVRTKEQQEAYCQAKGALDRYFAAYKASEGELNIQGKQLKDPAIRSFFKLMEQEVPESHLITKELLKSWTIYNAWFTDWYKSELLRSENMKQNFSRLYWKAMEDNEQFKAFLKLGQVHTVKGRNRNQVYDIGNFVYELAHFQGNSSLHLTTMKRYQQVADGSLNDYYEEYGPFKIFLGLASPHHWVLINLAPIRSDITSRKIKASEEVQDFIFGNDMLLLLPADAPFSPNYDAEKGIDAP